MAIATIADPSGEGMESIYYVISWLCHRHCAHCYDTRFRPYVRDECDAVADQAVSSHAKIVSNLPERMTYLETDDGAENPVRVILSGGEVLLDETREPVLYPVMEMLREKYVGRGGVRVVVQTTGDLVTAEILDELLARGMWRMSITGMDDFPVGHEGAKRVPLIEYLTEEPLTKILDNLAGRPAFEAINAGVNEYLAKPVRPVDLFHRITALIERPRRFIKASTYFGPDRRRRQDPRYNGPWRRSTDEEKSEAG